MAKRQLTEGERKFELAQAEENLRHDNDMIRRLNTTATWPNRFTYAAIAAVFTFFVADVFYHDWQTREHIITTLIAALASGLLGHGVYMGHLYARRARAKRKHDALNRTL